MAANGAGPSAFDKAQSAALAISVLQKEIKGKQDQLKAERANLAKYRKEVLAAMSGAKRGPRKKKEVVEEPVQIGAGAAD